MRGLRHRVVMQLVDDERLEEKGYVIFTYNFYSSPSLFKQLVPKGFGACGTARKDRRGISTTVRDARLKNGEKVSSTDDDLVALKWHDKRDVVMFSTYHNDSMVT